MKIVLMNHDQSVGTNIAMRCPHCGYNGTFNQLGIPDVRVIGELNNFTYMGLRKCPNIKCLGQLFFIMDNNSNIIYTSPSEVIPFDNENIPDAVLNAFKEAVLCHSNSCYIASGIMIRKTLEEICLERGVTGRNLKDKIYKLKTKLLLPKELLDGVDELRLLGNDAAHVKAKTFADIGKKENEVSIDFTKELLKAVYQYENLLSKLRALKVK